VQDSCGSIFDLATAWLLPVPMRFADPYLIRTSGLQCPDSPAGLTGHGLTCYVITSECLAQPGKALPRCRMRSDITGMPQVQFSWSWTLRSERTERSLLRIPDRTLAAPAHDQRDRVDVRDTLSSIRQHLPTAGRLRLRNAFSSSGTSLITQRCTLEWSTSKPSSAIISSRLRRPSEYATYHRAITST
jgi:hypothetical protein